MTDLAPDQVYVRSCALFPDGLIIPAAAGEELKRKGLAVDDDGWLERETPPGDLQAVYGDDDWDEVENKYRAVLWRFGVSLDYGA